MFSLVGVGASVGGREAVVGATEGATTVATRGVALDVGLGIEVVPAFGGSIGVKEFQAPGGGVGVGVGVRDALQPVTNKLAISISGTNRSLPSIVASSAVSAWHPSGMLTHNVPRSCVGRIANRSPSGNAV